MRILQVNSCFYPAWAYGGPVPIVYHVSKELVKRGHEVVVYTTDAMDISSRQKARHSEIEGVTVYYFRNISNILAWHYRLFIAPGMLFQLKKESREFDVIHLQDFRTLQSILIHYHAKKHGIPYVLQAHGSVITPTHKGRKAIFDIIWGRRILRDASKIIALTPMEAEQYKSLGISVGKVEIVPNGIDFSEFENLPQRGEFRRKHSLNDEQKVILYLGRINKIKGLDLLVEAFAELQAGFDGTKLVIVGPDDGYLAALQKLVRKQKIDGKVLFTGPLYGNEKLEAYVDADVYVLPSIYETFPVSVLEACACGTPVVVTDRCGIADVINGVLGHVVPRNKTRLQQVLLSILEDKDLNFKNKQARQRFVRENFDWAKIVEQLERIYLSVW